MAVTARKTYVNGHTDLYLDPEVVRVTFSPNALHKVLAPGKRGPVTLEVRGASQGSIARHIIDLEGMGRYFSRDYLLERGWAEADAGGL